MGLLGGFKAKFTSKVSGKQNNNTKDVEVVCTKYRINSEFEDNTPIVYKHNPRVRLTKPKRTAENDTEHNSGLSKQYSKSLNDLKFNLDLKSKNPTWKSTDKAEGVAVEVLPSPNTKSNKGKQPIKIRPAHPLPETSTTNDHGKYDAPFGNSTISKEPEENLPPLPKSLPPLEFLKQTRFQHEYDEPIENSNTSANGSAENGIMKSNPFYTSNHSNNKRIAFNTTADDYEEISPGTEYKVTFPVSEPSTPSSNPQRNAGDGITSTSTDPPTTFQFTNGFTEDHRDIFKVNHVKYDRNYSMSEDEISNNELDIDDVSSYTQMGYTSQAASIFFGEDLSSGTSKPRKVLFQATNDEEDC